MEEYLKLIVGLSIFVTIAILVIICFVLDNKYKKFVLDNSEKLQQLIVLNKSITFHQTIEQEYHFKEILNSKRKLDNTSTQDFFIVLIENNYKWFKTLKKMIKDNISRNNIYINKYSDIKSTATEEFCKKIKTKQKRFLRYENNLFNKLIIHPSTDTKFIIALTYTSPKGKNSYSKSNTFSFDNFIEIFKYTTMLIETKQTRQYQIQLERSKMSDSLRYDILKRDGFKCQICGVSAKDGAKLHIDHILPVSKGGKTESQNLRTLCERCNIGKSDKIE